MRSSTEIESLFKEWETYPLLEKERIDLTALAHDKDMLFESFYTDLRFGTAGIRGIVGLGPNRMNSFNVKKAALALAKTALKQDVVTKKAVISYDSRLSSWDFTLECASIFKNSGFKVFIMEKPTPTPVLSFAVRHLNCDLGVMITASHNPLNYNGFKAYLNDGKQVSYPFDETILQEYANIKPSDIEVKRVEDSQEDGIELLGDDFYEYYFEVIGKQHIHLKELQDSSIKAVYTPLHGTGGFFAQVAAQKIGYKNLAVVESQNEPDGTFPTTDFPNPEDPESLKLAVKQMLASKADVVIGSDPDADRMGVVLNKEGTPYFLNGNEIANLMLYYRLSEGVDLSSQHYVVSSIVSSRLQRKMSEHFGVTFYESLTGFKWICNFMNDENQDKFLFGSEESFGNLTHSSIRDKDGISGMTFFLEMLSFYQSKNKNLFDVLSEMYDLFGYHEEKLLNFKFTGSEGVEKIKRIMDYFGEANLSFNGSSYIWRKNFETHQKCDSQGTCEGFDFEYKERVLSFYFKEGIHVHVRPSGTEPKLKIYTQGYCEKNNKEQVGKDIKKMNNYLRDLCEKL